MKIFSMSLCRSSRPRAAHDLLYKLYKSRDFYLTFKLLKNGDLLQKTIATYARI